MARGLVSALAVFLFGLGIVLVGRIGVRKVVKSSGSNCVLVACADGVGDVLDICNARVADTVSAVSYTHLLKGPKVARDSAGEFFSPIRIGNCAKNLPWKMARLVIPVSYTHLRLTARRAWSTACP